MSILVCNNLDGEERAGCFDWFVFLVSRDCCVALPRGFVRSLISRYFLIILTISEYMHATNK